MIELKDICKTYKSGSTGVNAVRNVSLKIEAGEFVAIMGPSGSGKSSLLHLLGFLDRPDGGSYKIYGEEVSTLNDDELAVLRNRLAGFVFQQFHLLPRITSLENIELPLIYAGQRNFLAAASENIKKVGLIGRASHRSNQLSGGEQQRIAIARALVNEPLIIFADEPTGNLDTKSKTEIMSILKELNKAGKTIIMVTHEPEMSEYATRIVRMRDGEIIADELKTKPAQNPGSKDDAEKILHTKDGHGKTIEFLDYVRQAFQAIFSNKVRSFLSMLGITIGIAAVIAMSALGEGAKRAISQQLASLGSNVLSVNPGSSRVGGVSLQAGSVTRFTLQDSDAIALLPMVKDVAPMVRGNGQIVYQDKNWNTRVQGEGVHYATIRAAVPTVGRFFTDEDVRNRRKVAVIGLTVAQQLFGTANPLGNEIKINRINFTVIGVLPVKGSNGFQDQDDLIVIPVTTAMFRVMGKDYVDSIDVEVRDPSSMTAAQDAITNLIMFRQHLRDSNSFQIRNMADIKAVMETTTQTMSMLLAVIAAISLVVGGIGIMNIMLVSVTERTREIGLRKAIGARNRDILTQFLIEAIAMTFSGGIIGLLLGMGIAEGLSLFAGWSTFISTKTVSMAIFFSVFVGLVFGISPARQAAQLNPIEALRYE